MIRLAEIQRAFLPLVGWKQSYNPGAAIAEDLTQSESGLYYQGAHPLVTLDNVRAIMPDTFGYQYPEWVSGQYSKGAKVAHEGKVWKAKADTSSEPGHSADWAEYDFLSDYLRDLTLDGISTTIQTFLQGKQLNEETKSLLERRTFFDGAARLQAIINPTAKLVGFAIVPVRAMGVTMRIERIGFQARGGSANVTFYLFHSSRLNPVWSQEFEINANGGFQWLTPSEPLYLPYISGSTDAGGAWFLCYNQEDLGPVRALNISRDWSKEPCATCWGYGLEAWKEITKYMQVTPFCIKAPDGFRDYPEMFDIGEVAYTTTINYGLNCEVSIGCDLTDFIISQRELFATALQKQVAASVLRTIAMNPDVRVNRNQVNVTRDGILYELDGNPQGRASGLGYELAQAYKALSLDTRGLDRVCLQCNNHGVKYRTI